MTGTRPTRRAAEIAIIDAAYSYVNAPIYADMIKRERTLAEAVNAHREIGLDDTHQPAFSNNSTDTSAAAGASVRGTLGKLAQQCFDEIEVVKGNGGAGLTVDQLEQLLNRSHQSVSARVNELRDKGWVRDSGFRRPTRSGRKAIVWIPTAMT